MYISLSYDVLYILTVYSIHIINILLLDLVFTYFCIAYIYSVYIVLGPVLRC